MMSSVETNSLEEMPSMVRFNDSPEILSPDHGENDQGEESRWFSQTEIASFRDDAIRTVQALNACGGDESELDADETCLRGLEKKMLKRPPPNFVRSLLRLQAHQRRTTNNESKGELIATSLQLFSIASSKWARKRALQLAGQDEYDAYRIFMAGLKQYGNANDNDDADSNDDDDDDYDSDEEDDFAAFCDGEEEEFDFCTEGNFVTESDYVNTVYNLKNYSSKHDSTEDETEYDDSYGDECDIALMMVGDDTDGDRLDPEANDLLVR